MQYAPTFSLRGRTGTCPDIPAPWWVVCMILVWLVDRYRSDPLGFLFFAHLVLSPYCAAHTMLRLRANIRTSTSSRQFRAIISDVVSCRPLLLALLPPDLDHLESMGVWGPKCGTLQTLSVTQRLASVSDCPVAHPQLQQLDADANAFEGWPR
ncbi:hypothetical protein FB451DRAFT_1254391 [Mycena latifolia]|nr:hypothetical protein FB451DRAFT_1254391 [Mycena latifolia]